MSQSIFIPRARSLDQSVTESKGEGTRESSNQYIHSISRDVNVDAGKNNKGKQEHAHLEDQVGDKHGIRNSFLSGSSLVWLLTECLPNDQTL